MLATEDGLVKGEAGDQGEDGQLRGESHAVGPVGEIHCEGGERAEILVAGRLQRQGPRVRREQALGVAELERPEGVRQEILHGKRPKDLHLGTWRGCFRFGAVA